MTGDNGTHHIICGHCDLTISAFWVVQLTNNSFSVVRNEGIDYIIMLDLSHTKPPNAIFFEFPEEV